MEGSLESPQQVLDTQEYLLQELSQKNQENELLYQENAKLQEQLKRVFQENVKLQEQLKKYHGLEKRWEEAKAAFKKHDMELAQLQQKLTEAEKKVGEREKAIVGSEQLNHVLQQEMSELREEKDRLKEKIDSLPLHPTEAPTKIVIDNTRMEEAMSCIIQKLDTLATKQDINEMMAHESRFQSQSAGPAKELVEQDNQASAVETEQAKTQDGIGTQIYKAIFKKQCNECELLKQKLTKSQEEYSKVYRRNQRLSRKMNDELRLFQGGTDQDTTDAQTAFRDLFVNAVDDILTPVRSTSRSKPDDATKDLYRASLCSVFMKVAVKVRDELLNRIRDTFESLFKAQREPNEYDANIKRAFAILLGIPSVSNFQAENFEIKFESFIIKELDEDLKVIKKKFPSADCKKFVEQSLQVAIKLLIHVPPFLPSCKYGYSPRLQEIRTSTIKPQERMRYIQPILFYNFQGEVLAQGIVNLQQEDIYS